MKFSDIIGHSDQINILRNCVDNDRIPHASLISGPVGIGKLKMARAFAQYIHCQNRTNGDSCGICPSCLQHQSMNHTDMHFIFPVIKKAKPKVGISEDYLSEWKEFIEGNPYASYDKWLETINAGNSQPLIYVEESANILHKVNLSSYTSKYKIILIWLPEKMKEEAANKLLKVIEEPFDDTKFILVSNDVQSILPTIFSRTQRINLKKLDKEEITSAITQRYGIAYQEAYEIARISDGNIIQAFDNLQNSDETIEFRNIFQDLMRKAFIRDIYSLKTISESIADMGREKSRRFLSYLSLMIRENFIYNLHESSLNNLNAEDSKFSERFAPFINERNVEKIIEETNRAESDIARNANAKIVMFDFCIKLIILIKT